MPRPRPPHVHMQVTRHGKRVWYFRRGHGPRVRLPVGPGEAGFEEAYQAATSGEITPQRQHTGPRRDTFAWAVARYRETSEWGDYGSGTRRARDAVFVSIIAKAGDRPLASFTRAVIEAGVAKRKPGSAWGYLGALKPLFRWAVRAGHVSQDPTAGIARPALRKGGWVPWTDDEMAAFEAAYPVGTRERVPYDIARFTGLRRSDIARIGRQHVRAGVIRITARKNAEKRGAEPTRITMEMHPVLADHLARSPIGDLAFVSTSDGKPLTDMALSQFFKRACRAIGVRKSLHGIRKAAAEDAAELGATEAQLMAVFGWTDPRMAAYYTRLANRERLGLAGSRLIIEDGSGTSIPSPRIIASLTSQKPR